MKKAGLLSLLSMLLVPAMGLCGGAWVPQPGDGDVQLGFSRKTASSSWDTDGETFRNLNGQGQVSYHDFRYAYLSGEIGLLRRLSTRFLVTYLDGFEGPHNDLEQNTGMSDAWFGLKYAVAEGSWPMAVGATMRTAYFYDLPGAYNRALFDSQGQRRGVSPEWRGLLKEDYSLTYLLSHSYLEGRGWMNFETGYTWRAGAPADQIPVSAEVGYPLPFLGAAVKGSLYYVRSQGNVSPRQLDDRFGSGAVTNFNDASMGRLGVSFLAPLDRSGKTNLEIGYNQWVWGISARRYREPFLSVGRSF
ncbi:MAG TPA: hypothetical protein VN493_11990 [Thermoanaerobaculia bacterium]|nr:hypothetical protein [Thermoanaerobaculia bacterium]